MQTIACCFISFAISVYIFYTCIEIQTFRQNISFLPCAGAALSSWSCSCRSGTPALWRGERPLLERLFSFVLFCLSFFFVFLRQFAVDLRFHSKNTNSHYEPESADTRGGPPVGFSRRFMLTCVWKRDTSDTLCLPPLPTGEKHDPPPPSPGSARVSIDRPRSMNHTQHKSDSHWNWKETKKKRDSSKTF